MSEFAGIADVSGWQATLTALLQDATAAAQQDALAPRLAVVQRLIGFIAASSPHTAEMLALDEIALTTAQALLRQTMTERLAAITARQEALRTFLTEIQTEEGRWN